MTQLIGNINHSLKIRSFGTSSKLKKDMKAQPQEDTHNPVHPCVAVTGVFTLIGQSSEFVVDLEDDTHQLPVQRVKRS